MRNAAENFQLVNFLHFLLGKYIFWFTNYFINVDYAHACIDVALLAMFWPLSVQKWLKTCVVLHFAI